jgi:hypothetical protein
MGQAVSRATGLEAGRGRAALAGAATVVVALLALALTLAGVADGEVVATLLFLPVFVTGLLAGRAAGYVAAAIATAVYVAVRRDDLSSAATASAGVLTLTRAGAYVVAGHVGALARSLTRGAPAPDRRPAGAARDRAAPARTMVRDDWEQVWESADVRRAPTQRAAEPVLAGVGSSLRAGYDGGAAWPGDQGGNGVYSTTMSGAWPPDPPGAPWADEGGQDPSRGHVGPQDETPWSDDGWSGAEAGGPPGGSGWPGAARPSAPVDDSWDAVQQSWRQQHGLPPEEERPQHGDQRGWHDRDSGGDGGWPAGNGASPTDAWAPAAPAGPEPWGPPAGGGADAWGSPPGAVQDGWPQGRGGTWDEGGGGSWEPAGADAWGQPTDHGAQDGGWAAVPPDDPWGDRAPTGGTWPDAATSAGGWPDVPAAPTDPRGADPSGWPQVPQEAHDGWPESQVGREGGEAGGWPYVAPSGQAGWRTDTGQADAWAPGGSPAEPGQAWGGQDGRTTTGSHESPWGAPEPPRRTTGEWPAAGGAIPPHTDLAGEQGGWGALAGDAWPSGPGRSDARWDRADGGPPSGQRTSGWTPAVAGNGAPPAPPGGSVGGLAGRGAGGLPGPRPAVDPETGLWTAQFLRDRLNAEQARSRRSGHPYSLVLVQVPDGPLAQLPYRRQLTLLRELGYQFVAGGVVDHLVHVPDQNQHWFAVILPETDRSGAHVLERRLRLGIGGYLSSRGLRLHELQSASLTAPDDDPSMDAIWDALTGAGDSH